MATGTASERFDLLVDDAGATWSGQLAYVRAERDDLRASVALAESEQNRRVAEALGDPAAVFILRKVVETEGVAAQTLAANLSAPTGWILFANLWRAGLVEYHNGSVVPTDLGVETAAAFPAIQADRRRAGSRAGR